jgi:hypothetical protein
MRWSSRQGDGLLRLSSPGPEAYTTCADVNSRSQTMMPIVRQGRLGPVGSCAPGHEGAKSGVRRMAEHQVGWSWSDSEASVQPAPVSLPPFPPLPPLSVPSWPPLSEPAIAPQGPRDFSAVPVGRASNGRAKQVALLTAGGVIFFTNRASTPIAIKSPAEANATLYAAAVAAGSFHYADVTTGTVGGQPVTATQSGDSGHGEGVQYMTSALGNYESSWSTPWPT